MRKRTARDPVPPAARSRRKPLSARVVLRNPVRPPDRHQGTVLPNVPVAPWPDLEQRAHAIFGDRVLNPGASSELLKEREERQRLLMGAPASHVPRCIIIAGPNGAGKTTFAREFLPRDEGVVHFVNADLIAAGLSPFRPELVALAAGRLLLRELDRLAASRKDFAFESTLSGLTYVSRLRRWRAAGYRIEIVFLSLVSPQLALRRIAARVRQGGHNVPRADVLRRFDRGRVNFDRVYRLLSDAWAVYDNSGPHPRLLEKQP